MNKNWHLEKYLIPLIALALFWPSATRVVTGASSGVSGRMAFQRSVDSASPGPNGTVDLKISGTKQTIRVDIRDLEGDSFGLFLGFNNQTETNVVCDTTNLVCVTNLVTSEVICSTNCVTNEVKVTVGLIGALKGLTNNHWVVEYEANNGLAPIQLLGCFTDGISSNCISSLSDLTGMFLFIAKPGSQSNIVDAVLFAEVPPLTGDNSALSFKGKTNLTVKAVPPNPDAKGTISSKFNATQGQSFLDIRAQKLFGNQIYTLYISSTPGGPADTELADLPMRSPTAGAFRRDTAEGEALPLSAPTVKDLSGHNIELRDAFGDVHLKGTIP